MVKSPELVERLEEQVRLLHIYADIFDSGNVDIALPMSTSIRVLLHDTGGSTSLLKHLGVKHQVLYTDTAMPIRPGNLLPTPGLLFMRISSKAGGTYEPPLGMERHGGKRPPLSFSKWWKTPVTIDAAKNQFSRRDFVLNTAHKLGGAHVDPAVPDDIAHFKLPESLGWQPLKEGGQRFNSPLPPAIRQIVFETIDTIEQQVFPLL